MTNNQFRLQTSRLVWLIFGVIEALLSFRILFRLIDANPNAPIVTTIYQLSGWLLNPFENIAASPRLGPGVMDLPAILALFAYVVASWLTLQLISVLLPPGLDNQETSLI